MSDNRQALIDRLADLHRDELAAIDNAEQSRREAIAAAEAAAKELAEQKAKLAALVADDLADVKQAEDSARSLAASIGRRLQRNVEMARLAHEISGGPVPTCLHFPEVMSRIGGWVGAILAAALKPRGRIGGLQWSGTTLFPAATKSWRDVEAKAYQTHITPLTKGN